MNENEAKYYLLEHKPIIGFKTHNEALDVAIQALEDVQQYRAIGTVEDCRAAVEKQVAKTSENYVEKLVQVVCKTIVEGFENLTIEDVNMYEIGYSKAIDDFSEKANKEITKFVLNHKDNLDFASGISVAWNIVDEIAEQMKGGAV